MMGVAVKVRAVTRCTVTANCKGLAIGAVRRYQATVCIMTVDTTNMRVRCRTPQSIVMTARTVGRGYLNQGRMIRRDRGMRRIPG